MADMSIDAVNMINRMNSMSVDASSDVEKNSGVGFGDTFKTYLQNVIGSVEKDQVKANKVQMDYIKDDPNVSLSKVMIQMQKAEISLSALVTVRNKVLEGYKTLLDMSI